MRVKLEKVQKDLRGFDYEVQMYIYHKMNGRDEEAQSYLDSYIDDANIIIKELVPVGNEAFETPQENSSKIIVLDEVDERQGAIIRQGGDMVIEKHQPIKFNIFDFHE